MPENTQFVCTKKTPWTKEITDQTVHPDAKHDGECSDGCCDYYMCPNCGLSFRVEASQ